MVIKGLLKGSAAAALKVCEYLPIELIVGGGLLGIGCGISSTVIYENIKADYRKTPIYASEFIKDINEANSAYLNGEIGQKDFENKIAYLGTDKYVEEVIKRDYKENDKYQAKLKTSKKLTYSCFAGVGAIALGGISALVWYPLEVNDSCWSVADDLFTDAEIEFDESRENRAKKKALKLSKKEEPVEEEEDIEEKE